MVGCRTKLKYLYKKNKLIKKAINTAIPTDDTIPKEPSEINRIGKPNFKILKIKFLKRINFADRKAIRVFSERKFNEDETTNTTKSNEK